MKYIACITASVLLLFSVAAQDVFQLAPPIMKYPSVFFSHKAEVVLAFAQPGTVIHYTTNGNEPDENDPSYTGPVVITDNFTTLKARVFGKGFLPSETTQATFVKDGLPLKKIEFSSPNKTYGGEGVNTLMDNKGGATSYTSKTWLGFNQDTVSITISLNKKQKTGAVLFNLLQDYGSWIFFPYKAEVYSTVNARILKQGELFFTASENIDVNVCRPYLISFKRKIKTDFITLKFYLRNPIPEWHPGKGQPSWIFIDEVKLY
jgi:hypothetical protein